MGLFCGALVVKSQLEVGNLQQSLGTFIALLSVCTFAVHEVERSHRMKWFFQTRLSESLESERQGL